MLVHSYAYQSLRHVDTSCILLWLIEQGYEVIAFMADVGQEEVSFHLHLEVLYEVSKAYR